MDQRFIKTLQDEARKFLSNTQEVNKSIVERINYSKKIIEYIDESLKLDEKFQAKIIAISDVNLALRNEYYIIFNTCIILNINIVRQKKIIRDLQKLGFIDPEREKRLMYRILLLSESLQKGLSLIQEINEKNNEILLLDYQIIIHKQFQSERIEQLKKMSTQIQTDAGIDIKDSNINLGISARISEQFAELTKMIEAKDRKGIVRLIDEIKKELNIEENINKRLTSRLESTEKINRFAQQLYLDSSNIKELVDFKNSYFRDIIEHIAELAVVLALEINEYLRVKEIIDDYQHDNSISSDIRKLFNNFVVHARIACNNIDSLGELNQYMVEIFDSNAKREEQIIKLTQMNLHCYENIKNDVETITNSIGLLVGVSQNNIVNGQILEKGLKKIVAQM